MIKHKGEVNKLATKRRGKINTKLWDDAASMLSKNGSKYTAKQCSIKWKNIKKDYDDKNNQSSNNIFRYKSEVEEILSRNRANLGVTGKRKMLDEE